MVSLATAESMYAFTACLQECNPADGSVAEQRGQPVIDGVRLRGKPVAARFMQHQGRAYGELAAPAAPGSQHHADCRAVGTRVDSQQFRIPKAAVEGIEQGSDLFGAGNDGQAAARS